MKSHSLDLPWPPSLNHAYPVDPRTGRKYLSPSGKAYVRAVNDCVTLQHVRRHEISGSLALEIIARFPDNKRRDLDNLLKVPLDSLKKAGVIVDDSDIVDLRICRGLNLPAGAIRIIIHEISAGEAVTQPLFSELSE